jgi:hypothetical protein
MPKSTQPQPIPGPMSLNHEASAEPEPCNLEPATWNLNPPSRLPTHHRPTEFAQANPPRAAFLTRNSQLPMPLPNYFQPFLTIPNHSTDKNFFLSRGLPHTLSKCFSFSGRWWFAWTAHPDTVAAVGTRRSFGGVTPAD